MERREDVKGMVLTVVEEPGGQNSHYIKGKRKSLEWGVCVGEYGKGDWKCRLKEEDCSGHWMLCWETWVVWAIYKRKCFILLPASRRDDWWLGKSEKPFGSHTFPNMRFWPLSILKDLLSGINISFTTDCGCIAVSSLKGQLVRRQH